MFINSNFTTVARTEEFLNLSGEEVKTWISSDEIDVRAEEDVFKIILAWIDCEKSERKRYFCALFREVRLVYVARDFLHNVILTNDLVSEHKGCRDLVKDAMKLIDSGIHYLYSNKPRKSLESSVIVLFRSQGDKSILLYYFPQENKLSRLTLSLGQITMGALQIVSSRDKIYFNGGGRRVLVYDSFTDCWTTLSPDFKGGQVFANEGEIYIL